MQLTEAAVRLSALNSRGSHEIIYVQGFSRRKLKWLKLCLGGARLRQLCRFTRLKADDVIVTWGASHRLSHSDSNRLIRVEDGFLRSVGLGADLVRPLSWVLDEKGIYFDSRQESDLENLLNGSCPDTLLDRARRLRARIVRDRRTKYNLVGVPWRRPKEARRVILVAGQVETDGSILYGSPTVRTNIDLLTQVRARNPNSYILYKRHPDIVAGLRASEVCEDKIASLCDERVDHVDIVTLIDGSDEVHVMTSLTGFEALMRGKEVVCYGQPFYAGWGLTTDLAPIARRLHKITLDHLVAMALIVYPVYMSADGQRLITPEEALDELTTLALAPNRGAVLKKALRCGLRLRARYHGS